MTALAFAATCPLCGERMAPAAAAPVMPLALPCRFGCAAPAVALVHYPDGDARLRDPLQALCHDHLAANDKGAVVAWLGEERKSVE